MKQAHRFNTPGGPYEGLTRLGPNGPTWTGKIRLVPEKLADPLKWKKPARIFVNSMSDLFHEDVPDEFIDRVFAVMASAYWHTFQVLTKRADRMAAYMNAPGVDDRIAAVSVDVLDWGPPMKRPAVAYKKEGKPIPWNGATDAFVKGYNEGFPWPLPNCWMGVSCENQATADERIPHLLKVPASVRFLSCEPLLGPVDLTPWLFVYRCPVCERVGQWDNGTETEYWCQTCGAERSAEHCREITTDLHWVIVGGESGPGARPMHPDWARGLRDQCKASGVAYHFKQWGEWAFHCRPTDADELVQACLRYPNGRWVGPNGESTHVNWDVVHMVRVGKKAAGRLLDGVEWNEFPEAAHA